MVVKKDGRREKFDRQKVMQGLVKASEKRPISMGKLAEIIDDVETSCRKPGSGVIDCRDRGAAYGESEGLDKIAYVRFASVYRDFQDVDAFLREVSDLVKQKRA